MTRRKKLKVKKKKSTKIRNAEPMDLASFEGTLSNMFGDSDERTPLRMAQDLIYDVWEVTDPRYQRRFLLNNVQEKKFYYLDLTPDSISNGSEKLITSENVTLLHSPGSHFERKK
jgi:hypothetical protein